MERPLPMKIFSGKASERLAAKICKELSLDVGKVHLKSYPSGEKYCQYEENIRGNDVFLVQATSFPCNDNLMELLVMADAARRASAGRLTAVIPYFGYSRQDRKDKSRVPISAKLIMDLLAAAGFDRILTMDLHAEQIQGFTNLPVDQLSFKPTLVEALNSVYVNVVVAPDIGSVKRADEYATKLRAELAIVSKKRKNETTVEVKHFIGDVAGKNVVIIDDLTESAGTLIEAAIACREQKAATVNCAITHGCFTSVGDMRLAEAFEKGTIDRLFVSNSIDAAEDLRLEKSAGLYGPGRGVPIPNFRDKLTVVDVSQLFATAIKNIHNNESVSELFR